jgi:hypothetical protein
MRDSTKKELQRYQIKIDGGLTDGVNEIVEMILPDILNGMCYLGVEGGSDPRCKNKLRDKLGEAIFHSIQIGLKK